MSTKARTIQETIDYLKTWVNKDQKIAFAIWTAEDISADAEYYVFPNDSLRDAWNEVVDEVQADLNEGYHVEVFSEAIREITERHFPLKEVNN